MMACSVAGRDIVYYTFGDTRLRDLLHGIHCFFQRYSVTVSQLWRYLCRFNEAQLPPKQLYPFIQQAHLDSITVNSFSKSNDNDNNKTTNIIETKIDDGNQKETKTTKDSSSIDIIESSQPELPSKFSFVSESLVKKPKLKKLDENETKNNHEKLKKFLYSSDEDDDQNPGTSTAGFMETIDKYDNKLEENKQEDKELNDGENMECDFIEDSQENVTEINNKSPQNTSKNPKVNEKKITDFFKIITK